MTISPNASTVWRNYETDGVPASGNHKVKKSAARTWGTAVESAIDAYSSGAGSIAKATRALLYADLAHAADVMAWVYADSTVGYNGIYRKSGASGTGSWTRILDLPYDVIIATDVGAGTANAILATSTLPVSEAALILLNVFEANTGAVTVAFNGGSALTIKTASGNDVASGGLVAGMALLGKITGSTFRMVSDQASAAIQAAAEAAQVAAEATLADFETRYLGSFTTAAQPTLDNVGNALAVGAIYWNSTESEMRIWDGATWLAFSGGIADGSITDAKIATASALNKRMTETISPFDPAYGALGGATDDRVAIQAAWAAGAAGTKLVRMPAAMRAGGELQVEDNLEVEWHNGAWTYQTDFSTSGSFIENLNSSSADVGSIMANITLRNPQIDGSLFPVAVELEVSSSTSTTVTFTSAASAVDDYYLGMCIEDASGLNAGGLRIVTDYVGSTRTATHTTAWVSNPVATDTILAGWNDNAGGFAAGVSNISILGGIAKNYPANIMVPSGTGGKGWNFEQGVTNGRMTGLHAEDVGTAFFVQGVDGVFVNGEKRRASGIILSDLSSKRAGSALTVAGVNGSADPDGDSDDSMIVVDSMTYENSGHNPWRIVSSDHQKSGIINFLEAQNVSISNVRGRNDALYPNTTPGYPTDFAARCGYGLTGNVGAMVWGWGRNIKIDGFVHHGNVDNVIVVRRGRSLGDDAGGTGAPQNCFNWDFRGIEHHGVINEYVIRIDPTLGLRVAATELTGQIDVAVNGSFVTGGIVDPNMSSFTSLTLTVRDHVNQTVIIGTPAQIYAAGNTFASFVTGKRNDLRVVRHAAESLGQVKTAAIADDNVLSWTVPLGATAAELLIHQTGGSARGHLLYANGAWNIISQASTLIETSTSVLTGTTGTDTKVTVSWNGTTIYIENRLGASYTPYVIPKYYG